MKNLKMATKLSIIVIITLFISLSILSTITNANLKNEIQHATLDRMYETVQARAKVIDEYIANAENYVKGYAQAGEITQLLTQPGNQEAASKAQAYTERYAALDENLENVYVCNMSSVVETSLVTPVIGKKLREGDSLNQLLSSVFASKDVYNIGVMISPSTGAQVLSMYYPIYGENDQQIGFAGMALHASELMDSLNTIPFEGLDQCKYILLDAKNNTYLYSDKSELLGTDVTDTNHLAMLDKVRNSTTREIVDTEYKDSTTGKKMFAVYENLPERDWIFVIEDKKSEVYASVNKMSIMVIFACLCVLIIVGIIIWTIARLISKDLRKVGQVIQTAGQLDLTSASQLDPYINRKDEVGMIAKSTKQLVEAMASAFGQLKKESQSLFDESKNLLKISQQSVQTVQQVDQAVQDIAQGAASQAEETQKASENVIVIGNMVEETTKESNALLQNASDMNQASQEVMTTLDKLNESNKNTEKSMGVIYEQTNVTNESVKKIREVTSMIASIAEETSLLSLNASIEAARVGEQGKGFAVVATQIQQLAEQSNQSVDRINGIIESLVHDSSKSVEIMQQVQSVIQEQSEHVTQTIQLFGQLQTGIQSSIHGVDNISEKTNQMDDARKSVIDVVSNLSAIAQENAASAEETSASANIVNEMMSSIETASKQLSEVADNIEKNIEIFKVTV